jgi:phage terminase large subunit-like protein
MRTTQRGQITPWLDDLRTEILAFPHGKHDDQVDAFSQLMTWNERPKRTYSIKTFC